MARGRNWTKDELDYLRDNWGSLSIRTIAKNLGRTVTAIRLKAYREGLGPFLESGEYLTLNQLYMVIRGCDNSHGGTYTKQQWIEKGLPIKKRKVDNNSFQVVYLSDFWKWAEKNRTLIDFSKMEPFSLGEEPKWLDEQRKADNERKAYYKTTPWTKAEDQLLIDLLNTFKYSYRDLSKRLQRTEGAIKRRMIILGIKARPVRMPPNKLWTPEETRLLIDLYNKGYCNNTIANYINRSSQACGGKIERLIKEGILKPRSEYRKSC